MNHKILIRKLDYYGVRGIAKNWFTSYLSNRQQNVTINGVTSHTMALSCGVPHNINSELTNVHNWLCSNNLSLNIDKSNFVIFHPTQITVNFVLKLNNKNLKQEPCIKYLGIFIDSNLSWKHIKYIAKKNQEKQWNLIQDSLFC